MPDILWTAEAFDDLQRLDPAVSKRIMNKLTWFAAHFGQVVPEPLSGEFAGLYKLRVGDWRVIYSIQPDALEVVAVGHRREVYNQ